MTQNTHENQQSAVEQPAVAEQINEKTKKKGPAHGWLAWTSFVLTLAAWIMLHFSGLVCFWLAVAGLVASVIAWRQRNRACHNLALVSMVASAVLLVVMAIVYVALHYLLG